MPTPDRTSRCAVALLCSLAAGITVAPTRAAAQLANSPWPVFQQNVQHTGQAVVDGPTDGTVKWVMPAQQQLRSAPSVGADGTLFIGIGKAPFCAVEPAGGTKVWCATDKRGGDAAQSQPAVSHDGMVYGGARDNDLWAMHQELQPPPGEQTGWRFHVPFDGDVTAPPIIGPDGTIFFASNAISLGYVYAWNPAGPGNPGGSQKWFRKLGSGVHNSSPSLNMSGDTVYFSTADSTVHALDAATGATRWSRRVFPGPNGFRQSNFTVVVGPDDRIYVGARDGLHALDPNPTNTDATEAWLFPTSGRVESAAALATDGTLYIGSSRGTSGRFYAIRPDGTLKWSRPMKGKFQNCEAIVGANGTVYVGVGRVLYSLAPADGSILWSVDLPGERIVAPPVLGAPGVLYLGTLAGRLYAFGAP